MSFVQLGCCLFILEQRSKVELPRFDRVHDQRMVQRLPVRRNLPCYEAAIEFADDKLTALLLPNI